MRVSGPDVQLPRIVVHPEYQTATAWLNDGSKVSVINADDVYQDYPELRILEILAYGFFDYAARECLCFKPEDYFNLNACVDQDYIPNLISNNSTPRVAFK